MTRLYVQDVTLRDGMHAVRHRDPVDQARAVWDWIEAVVDAAPHAVPTTLLLPGIGTLHDLRQAHALGIRSVRVATHCTEAGIAAQHISAARVLGRDVAGS